VVERRVGVGIAAGCVAIGALALAIRLPGALHNAFWHDEVYSARVIVAHSPVAAVRQVERTESTPPGWYLLGWLLHHAGLRVAYVRVASAVAGALTAAAVVLLARRFMPLWAAMFAGLMTAVGYEFVYQGQQLRCYALLVLVAVLTVLALLRAAERPTIARLALVALAVAVGVYTHYFYGLVVIACLIWLVTSTAGTVRRRLGVSVLIGTAAVLPWVPAFLDQHARASYRFGIGHFRPGIVLSSYGKMFFATIPGSGTQLRTVTVVGLLAAVLGGAVLLWRHGPDGRLCALVATFPVVVSACLWWAGQPIFNVRNVLEAGPFAAVCVAAAFARLGRYAGPAAAVLAVVLLVPGVVRADLDRSPIPFDSIAAALRSEGWTQSDPMLTPTGMNWLVPLRWYLNVDAGGSAATTSEQPCNALFVITAGRFPASRVVGAPASASIPHRAAGHYLILRIPRGVPILDVPKHNRAVNVQCTITGLPRGVAGRLGLK